MWWRYREIVWSSCFTFLSRALTRQRAHAAKYWGSDANEFKPERFIDLVDQTDESKNHKWPRDAFLGFSGGHRSCMGQKFAMSECSRSDILRVS